MDITFITSRSEAQPNGCWLWTRYIHERTGYGQTRFRGVPGRLAHRVAYELANGPIPEGMTIDHLCFTPACVNPAHLRLLTPSENSQNQRRTISTHCFQGHEYTPQNTWTRSGKGGNRRKCRECSRLAAIKYRARKSANKSTILR